MQYMDKLFTLKGTCKFFLLTQLDNYREKEHTFVGILSLPGAYDGGWLILEY